VGMGMKFITVSFSNAELKMTRHMVASYLAGWMFNP